jgi:hypothetical protein
MIKKLIRARRRKAILLSAIVFSMVVVGLGVTPNFTCGCGEIENGTKLTFLINQVSKAVLGEPVFKPSTNR